MAKIIRASVINAQAYTVDQARRQLNKVHEKFQILARAQQATPGNRITASAFAQNSIRELLEFTAPVVIPITAARILAVGVKKKDGTKKSRNSDDKIAPPKSSAPVGTSEEDEEDEIAPAETPAQKAAREKAEAAKKAAQDKALNDMESAFGRPARPKTSTTGTNTGTKSNKIASVNKKLAKLYNYIENIPEPTDDDDPATTSTEYYRKDILLLARDLKIAELATGAAVDELQDKQHEFVKAIAKATTQGALEKAIQAGIPKLIEDVKTLAGVSLSYTEPKEQAPVETKTTSKPSTPKPSSTKVTDDPKTKAVEVSALKLYSAYAAIMALEPGVVDDIADFAGLAKEYWDALAKMFAKVPELAKLAKSGQKDSADTDGAPEDYMQAVQIAIDDFKTALAKAEKEGKVSVKQDIDAASIPSHAKLISQIEKFQRRYGDSVPAPEEADELKAQIKEMTTALSTAVSSVPEEAGIKSTVEKTIKEAQKFASSKKQPSDDDMVKMVDNMVMVVNLLSQVSTELAERAQEIAGGKPAASPGAEPGKDLADIAREAYLAQESIQSIASGNVKLTVSKVKDLVKTHFDKLLSLIPSIRALTDKFNSELDDNPAMKDKELRALIAASAEAMEVYISDVEDGNIDLEDAPEDETGNETAEDTTEGFGSVEDESVGETEEGFGSVEDEEGEIGDAAPEPKVSPTKNTKPATTQSTTDDWDDAPAQTPKQTPKPTPATQTPKPIDDWEDPPAAPKETPAGTEDNLNVPAPEEEEGYDATNAIKEAESQPEPKTAEELAPTTPVITPSTPGGNTFEELDTSGKGGRIRKDEVGKVEIPQVKITLDPQTKKEIARHRAIAADLTALFHELQSINSRVMSSLAQTIDDKQLKQIREFISRLGLQVRASLLNSMIAVREMTSAHIPPQYAATASNLYALITKTIPTERKVTAHTFMFMHEDELCFTTYYPLLRPRDARGKTLPRLFVYLTFRTDAHKMYVCTSTEMMALSEDLFRAPFSNAKNMKLALDRLLTLENFHSNLSKVNLATVFGKGGKDAESPVQMLERMSVNGFLPISGIAQDGDELVISLSPDIKEGQEQQVEIAYNKLQNILKTRLGKSYRIYMTYDYVNTDIDTELPVYNDLDDNEQTKPQDFTAVPHYEIRLSFKQVPGQEDITEAQLSFLKDRFMKLSDEAIRKMVRVANDS